jgi:hypothetical protein
LIVLRQGRELPDGRTRGLDSLMATHAGRGSCNTHVLAGVRIRGHVWHLIFASACVLWLNGSAVRVDPVMYPRR